MIFVGLDYGISFAECFGEFSETRTGLDMAARVWCQSVLLRYHHYASLTLSVRGNITCFFFYFFVDFFFFQVTNTFLLQFPMTFVNSICKEALTYF